MYGILASLVIVFVCMTTILIPFKFPCVFSRVINLFWDVLFNNVRETVLDPLPPKGGDPRSIRWIRVWGFSAAVAFTVMALVNDTLISDEPRAIASTSAYAILATTGSGIVVLIALAFGSYFPRARCQDTLRRCGFRSVWVLDHERSRIGVQEELAARARDSSAISIVDVTGWELIGKGAGPTGGVLSDALVANPTVPVFVLLFKPESRELDPERRRTSVFENLLTEMDLSREIFTQQVRKTLALVERLNASRPPEGKIRVRFYTEKPTLQTIVFDQSAIALSWHPRDATPLTLLEVAREAADASLYENYRRHFARLWGRPVSEGSFRYKPSEKTVETPWKASSSVRIPKSLVLKTG